MPPLSSALSMEALQLTGFSMDAAQRAVADSTSVSNSAVIFFICLQT